MRTDEYREHVLFDLVFQNCSNVAPLLNLDAHRFERLDIPAEMVTLICINEEGATWAQGMLHEQ